jgi:hypothetical protein
MVQKSEGIKLDQKKIDSQGKYYELRQGGEHTQMPGTRTKRTYKIVRINTLPKLAAK